MRVTNLASSPTVVTGASLSITLAIVTEIIGQEEIEFAISIILLSALLLVQFITIGLVRTRQLQRSEERRWMTALHAESAWSSVLARIAEQAQNVSNQGDATFCELATQRIAACAERLANLRSGQSLAGFGDTSVMIEQLRLSRRTVHATTFIPLDTSWWKSSAGLEYLVENERAIQRGVRIKRILLDVIG